MGDGTDGLPSRLREKVLRNRRLSRAACSGKGHVEGVKAIKALMASLADYVMPSYVADLIESPVCFAKHVT